MSFFYSFLPYFSSVRCPQTSVRISLGFTLIASAIRYGSSALSFIERFKVNSLKRALLIPVFLEISDLRTDFLLTYSYSRVMDQYFFMTNQRLINQM
jgi:hypothetical protein